MKLKKEVLVILIVFALMGVLSLTKIINNITGYNVVEIDSEKVSYDTGIFILILIVAMIIIAAVLTKKLKKQNRLIKTK